MKDFLKKASPEIFLPVWLFFALALAFLLPEPGSEATGITLAGQVIPSGCLFYSLTGLECPLCGLTRSIVSITHGEFSRGMNFHPLGPAVFVFLVFQISYHAAIFLGSLKTAEKISRGFLLAPSYVMGAALVAAWALRLVF